MAKEYNLRVMAKSFRKRELVWKIVLPLGSKYPAYGKWSPNWEGPFVVKKRVVKWSLSYTRLKRKSAYKSDKQQILKEICALIMGARKQNALKQ